MVLIFIAVEIWVLGVLCAWLLAQASRQRTVVVLAAVALAALGVLAVEMGREAASSVWDVIR